MFILNLLVVFIYQKIHPINSFCEDWAIYLVALYIIFSSQEKVKIAYILYSYSIVKTTRLLICFVKCHNHSVNCCALF